MVAKCLDHNNRERLSDDDDDDDGDGNKNGENVISLDSKTTTLHVHHAFFVHFLAVVARLRRETS